MAVDGLQPAVQDDHGHGQAREHFDRREVGGVQPHGRHVGLAVLVIQAGEARLVRRLLGEAADRPDAGQSLLQVGGDRADRLARAAEGAGGDDPEPQRGSEHERQHQERQQRQLDVQVQQDPDRAEQRKTGLEECDDRVGHEAVERLDVVRHARDQHAGRAALVEADGQRLQVLEDADAQVGERALSDPADEIGLHVGHRPHDQRRDEEGDDHDYERVDVALHDPFVDRRAGEQRGGERGRCAEHEGNEHHEGARAIRLDQRQQPAQVAPARAFAGALPGPLRTGPTRTSADDRAHSPLTSRSRGLRVRKTWSGRPFSTISRYSSEASSRCS